MQQTPYRMDICILTFQPLHGLRPLAVAMKMDLELYERGHTHYAASARMMTL